jgi:hypothetical protein
MDCRREKAVVVRPVSATAVLFDQCPGGDITAAVRALAECPKEMGLSYPANAGWRLWALAKAGRADVLVKDLRERWATMDSVKWNNTLQEGWKASQDSSSRWSHCAVAPLLLALLRPRVAFVIGCPRAPLRYCYAPSKQCGHSPGPFLHAPLGEQQQKVL